MKVTKLVLAVALALTAAPALAGKPNRDDLLVFISKNQLDQNLYNLLAATIPSTDAGKALYDTCGALKIEDLFENGYTHVRKTMGDVWRSALADVYENHLTDADLATLSGLDKSVLQNEISKTLTTEPIINDLRATLSPLVEEATGRQVNHMIDEAETLCEIEK